MALSPILDWENTPQIKELEEKIDKVIEQHFFGTGRFVFCYLGRTEILNILAKKYSEVGWNTSIVYNDLIISYGEVEPDKSIYIC